MTHTMTASVTFDCSAHPHRRLNPLTDEYVLISPNRNSRPWLGQIESPQPVNLPQYDSNCYLCPGNSRSGGQKNQTYDHTMTFENDFPAVLSPPGPISTHAPHPLMTVDPVHGSCDVLVFHPRHDLTMAKLPIDDIEKIVDEWIRVYLQRGKQEGIKYVQIFENKGTMMGCSNPHPHGQVWSLSAVPTIPSAELTSLRQYSSLNIPSSGAPKGPKGRPCLLCEYIHFENSVPEHEGRIVVRNDHWVALVPWWASWPFEILLLSHKRHIPSISHLTASERSTLAQILSNITIRYDNLFSCSFAYSMGIHQRPTPAFDGRVCAEVGEDDDDDVAHLHLHFSPPLLRSASVRKFLVGFELMAETQRDLTPEQAAKRLRECPEIHYIDSILSR